MAIPTSQSHPALAPVQRWTCARKAAVVLAVRRGEITERLVYRTHGVLPDELAAWEQRHQRFGQAGLAALQVQALR